MIYSIEKIFFLEDVWKWILQIKYQGCILIRQKVWIRPCPDPDLQYWLELSVNWSGHNGRGQIGPLPQYIDAAYGICHLISKYTGTVPVLLSKDAIFQTSQVPYPFPSIYVFGNLQKLLRKCTTRGKSAYGLAVIGFKA
jgi:hypothetical protein